MKSPGVTHTERMLADFCERSFLKLWSYPNPFKDDGHELCDLLAVFGEYIFIFFDRENVLREGPSLDSQVAWDRWKRNVIDRQVRSAHGAERYIRSGRPIFLDARKTEPFPLGIDTDKSTVHKIIVVHGAKEACERASEANVYGSLAISYTDSGDRQTRPFHIEIDKHKPLHIFDSHNLPIVLGELDTVTDFSAYLDEKLRAIKRFACLNYCGEEDILAHYLWNYDEEQRRHVIGPKDETYDFVSIGEGEWRDFINTDVYQNTRSVNQISYFWDQLIQRTCQNSLNGTLGGNSNIYRGQSAIYEMVKEPRFMRRALAEKMLTAVQRFPDSGEFVRHITFLPSHQPNVGYVLLQLLVPAAYRAEADLREKRQAILEIACGAAKNKFGHLTKVIGIGIEPPERSREVAEDFILMACETWTQETRDHYEDLNKAWNFFSTPHLREHSDHVTQFVSPPLAKE